MKTKTYARLSLLIPLFLWVMSLFVVIVTFALLPIPDSQSASEGPGLVAAVGMLLLIYVIGIFIWIIPYLLISLVLLFVSFISTEKFLKLAYFLAPIPMAAVMLIIGAALAILPFEGMPIGDDLTLTSFQYSAVAGALFAFVTLIFGYICVGLGFGGYMLMQFSGMIKGEEKANPGTKGLNSQSLQQELP